jgi:antirestriction protein ArdC
MPEPFRRDRRRTRQRGEPDDAKVSRPVRWAGEAGPSPKAGPSRPNAEIGAAFLCCDLGITPEPRDDHAAYLDHWLKVLMVWT